MTRINRPKDGSVSNRPVKKRSRGEAACGLAKAPIGQSLQESAAAESPPRLADALAAAWRHPFNSAKRKAYRRDRKAGCERKKSTTPIGEGAEKSLVGDQPSLQALHAELYENYVNNSLSKYDDTEFLAYEDHTDYVQSRTDVQLIAYYLPQFHPIPENDAWWGKGFTEWRNVTRAFPHFAGHYQPRIPGELGYYDLRVVNVMRRQAYLAKNYGISAFCFHFYWFDKKTLLEDPIKMFLEHSEIDIGFCLCWANENWSRRWDGSERELLITQNHSASDDIAFIRHLERYFRDPRYLRIDGRPILTVYRPSQLPDPHATMTRWREEIVKLGFPGIYLIATNAFGFEEYERFGFDALSEFPPHHVSAPNIQGALNTSNFRSGRRIRSYQEIVDAEKLRKRKQDRITHPGVMPSWDNSPRRPLDGEIIHGSTPYLFRDWLRDAVSWAARNPARQRLVFINAWNEWAEGAYLEPDSRFGYAYLDACRTVLHQQAEKFAFIRLSGARALVAERPTILLCGHWLGTQVYGGERSFLDVVSCLSAQDYNLVVILPNVSNSDYITALRSQVAQVQVFPYSQWNKRVSTWREVGRFIDAIDEFSPSVVYVNTIMVPVALLAARMKNITTIVHAREIIEHDPELLAQIGRPARAVIEQVRRSADWTIANSAATAESLGDGSRLVVVPNAVDVNDTEGSHEVVEHVHFGLLSSNFPKKGVADFVTLAEHCLTAEPRARFVIIGPVERIPETLRKARTSVSLPPNIKLLEYVATAEALEYVDVVVNFSHFQESSGRTVLEGMANGRPTIAYQWGALPELVLDGVTGFLVPFAKPEAAIAAVRFFCEDHTRVTTMGNAARDRAVSEFSMKQLARGVGGVISRAIYETSDQQTSYAQLRPGRLSAQLPLSIDIVICVHNALHEAQACLASVSKHTPDSRIIIVDDGSDPETANYLAEFAQTHRQHLLIRNSEAVGYTRAANAGLREATGDFVILLNSDTIVSPNWAEKLADAVFSTPGAGIVGPLSNAASYQSIPGTAGTASQTAVNEVPATLSVSTINNYCEEWTTGYVMPYVPLVHGFCFGITRETIDTLGYFDEKAFPQGYGEENDYCLRALKVGLWPVVATHTFVYHAKTKSYSEERRGQLVQNSQEILYERYGKETFLNYVRLLREAPRLVAIREKAGRLWESSVADRVLAGR